MSKPPEPRAPFPPPELWIARDGEGWRVVTRYEPETAQTLYRSNPAVQELVAAARSEARAEAFEEAAKIALRAWIEDDCLVDTYLKEKAAQARLPGKGVERPGEEK